MFNKKREKRPYIGKESICWYWESHIDECDLGVDHADSRKRCWRCSHRSSSLQKCHIIPHSLGGKSIPENMVILCADCHREAPNVKDKEFMLHWIKATRSPFYDCEPIQGYPFELIFGRTFMQAILDCCNKTEKKQIAKLYQQSEEKEFKEVLDKIHNKCTNHFGSCMKLNFSTRSWVHHQIEKYIVKKFKIKLPTDVKIKLPKIIIA